MSFTVFFFKQKTAYELRISDWSSDVCSSDLGVRDLQRRHRDAVAVGQRLLGRSAPARRRREQAGGLTGEAAAGAFAVAEPAQELVEILVVELGADLRHADVGVLGDHARYREHDVYAGVGGAGVAVGLAAGFGGAPRDGQP